MFQVFKEHPLMAMYTSDSTQATGLQDGDGLVFNQPNTALLSLVLMMGTFFVAFFLRKLRNSRFLGGKVILKKLNLNCKWQASHVHLIVPCVGIDKVIYKFIVSHQDALISRAEKYVDSSKKH